MDIAIPEDKKLKGVSVKNPMGLQSNIQVFMKDHSSKAIGALQIGDEILLGGKVTNIIKDKTKDVYNYKGLECTGNMKVLEDGRWLKVEESSSSRRLTNNEDTDICIVQSQIALFMTYDKEVFSSNLNDVTVELNTKHELNSMLKDNIKGLK